MPREAQQFQSHILPQGRLYTLEWGRVMMTLSLLTQINSSNRYLKAPGQVGISVEDITSVQKISELAVKKVKSVEVQTTREEEKDILLLSKPPVKSLSSIDSFSLPKEQKVGTIDPKPFVQAARAEQG